MTSELDGRDVVVTGGTGALGGAVLEHLLARGATCHVPCVEKSIPAHLAALGGGERLRATPGVDLGDEAAVSAYYAALPGLWASVQLAGGFAMAPATETSLADLRAMFELNAVTCFLACREAIRAIRRSGGGRGGRLVNVAARPALVPIGGMVAYTTSKAAVASLTACLAAEVQGEGILVNAVVPSIMDTPANRRATPDADFDRWPRPAEVAAAIGFLASPTSALTWGALVPVYGRA
jgi:NAD(P)-dependent dehydrogenase (short-subunit alcohol dehydrogenase family)